MMRHPLDILPVASVVNYIDSDPLPTIDDTKKLAKVENSQEPKPSISKKKTAPSSNIKKIVKAEVKNNAGLKF